jgi:predicted membrane-bound spermidine synthase
MRPFWAFFLLSGFCSLVYEVVWLRLAMAQFGVTTPMVSIVLSVFMAGLALGSWGAGLLARRFAQLPAARLIRLYAGAEFVIATSGLVVPAALVWGRKLLAAWGTGTEWGSGGYYLASGVWVGAVLLPFCVCMGSTFPLAMGAIRGLAARESTHSFSHLYVANVMGATLGTIASGFILIELFGFRGTLTLTAALNAILAACALAMSLGGTARALGGDTAPARPTKRRDVLAGWRILAVLFASGLIAMAMELIWVREFTPYLGNVVYAFSSILALYLIATFSGSAFYRVRVRRGRGILQGSSASVLLSSLGPMGLLPLIAGDYRFPSPQGLGGGVLRVAIGIGPLCLALGFLTPLLVDRWSSGDPKKAGSAYAVNVVGCILGPLVAAFVLLPLLGERWALFLLVLAPLFAGLLWGSQTFAAGRATHRGPPGVSVVAVGFSLLIMFSTIDFEKSFPGSVVRRDSTATVTAWGQGRDKHLLVNGMGMTTLTPITKMMAHLPLAFQDSRPKSALTVCLGMGTSFRSSLSWGIDATAVELVPSIPLLFGFFHNDARELLHLPRAHIVVDDGRRFLERSSDTYDAIIVDPPPPPEAAGSSLLYSREFYEVARSHLRPNGILQQWIPGGEPRVIAAFASALWASFPYVRAFGGMEGWGFHLLASMRPIPAATAAQLAARLPAAAARDLVEWGPAATPEEEFALVLRNEVPVGTITEASPPSKALVDDRPINEYYLLRGILGRW